MHEIMGGSPEQNKKYDACVMGMMQKGKSKADAMNACKDMMEKEHASRTVYYAAPIKITEQAADTNAPLRVTVEAIRACTSRNGITYVAQELMAASPSLAGKPLLLDHQSDTRNIVGIVRSSSWQPQEESIIATAEVMDPQIKTMIMDGRIQHVSVGANVVRIREEPSESEGQPSKRIAEGIDFMELSFTPTPGVKTAGIKYVHHDFAAAIAEAYELDNPTTPTSVVKVVEHTEDENMEADIKKMQETLDAVMKANEALNAKISALENAKVVETAKTLGFSEEEAKGFTAEQLKVVASKMPKKTVEEKAESKQVVKESKEEHNAQFRTVKENGRTMIYQMPDYKKIVLSPRGKYNGQLG